MRVCIVSDNVSAKFGGEAILPYHYFRFLSQQGVEVWLLAHSRTRSELQSAFPEYKDRILYTPDLWLHRAILRLSAYLPRRIAGSLFGLCTLLVTQGHQRRMIRKLVKEVGIDVVHQPTPVSPRMPSLMYALGAPVVIGPLNGGMDYPAAFVHQESFKTRAIVSLARRLSDLVNRLLPGKLQAATILVANQRTRAALPRGVRGRVMELVENAVDVAAWQPHATSEGASPFPNQFIFIGRLVSWKRLDIVLHALASLQQATLLVVGEGMRRPAWEQLCRELKISDRVSFLGWQPQEECARLLAQSTALVLPSIYECGGAVVLEAMASGKPVIATNWGGPADYLDPTCGVLIEPDSTAGMVEQFAAAMLMLSTNAAITKQMGQKGQARINEHFSWQTKANTIREIYREASERA
jgi:glycosyltransferase involved in cell wall biosynthesis